jgi:surface protein
MSSTFIYQFNYSGTPPSNTVITNNRPIVNTNSSFTTLGSSININATSSTVTVTTIFTYTEQGSNIDGLTFANVYNFYNMYSGLKITQFGSIPLARNGSQFFNLNSLEFTSISLPTILSNTSFINTFSGCASFNSDISGWSTNNINTMNNTFSGASIFNQNISSWDTSNVTNMNGMFQNATSFSQDISSWNIINVGSMNDMFTGATSFSPNGVYTNFNNLLTTWGGLNVQLNVTLDAPQSYYNESGLTGYYALTGKGWTINTQYKQTVTCFKENTKILCLINGKDCYVTIENIRPGLLVKTSMDGYIPVDMIGHSMIYNPKNKERTLHRLYKCTPKNYPELTEDLIITGCHSILVDDLTDYQREQSIVHTRNIYVTDDKYRLIACLDPRAEPYTEEGDHVIWHLALENENYTWNYGIYANGLLVESASQRMMKEYAGMKLM